MTINAPNLAQKSLPIVFFATLLVGCGGDSSDSEKTTPSQVANEVDRGDTDVDRSRFTAMQSIKNYTSGEISEQNAENLVIESVKLLRHIVETNGRKLADLDNLDVDQLTPQPIPNDVISLSEHFCDIGGSMTISIANGEMEISPNGFGYFGPGDRIEIEATACASSMLRASYRHHGSQFVEVIEGYYGWSGQDLTANTEIVISYEDVGTSSSSNTYSYAHGDTRIKVSNGQTIIINGESFKALDNGIESHEYALSNYHLRIDEVEGLPSYRTAWSMASESPFQFGLGKTGQAFEAEIISSLIYDDWSGSLQSGVFVLRDSEKSLKVELLSDYLTFALDLDGDGIYEIDSMLEDTEY